MTHYESKLKLNHLSNIMKISSGINTLLNDIYKEEYYKNKKENENKIVSVRCNSKNCNNTFIITNGYEIVSIKKEKRKNHGIQFKMYIKCKKCNYISTINLE